MQFELTYCSGFAALHTLSLPAELLGSVMELFNQVCNSVSTSMARFSYQNSTIPLVFKFWHSFYLRSTFVFKVRHLFLKVDVRFFFLFNICFCNFDVRFILLSICFYNFDVRFIQFNIHFFIRHLHFKFVICFMNSSSCFSTLTFVLSTLVLLSSEPTMNYGRLGQRNGDRKRSFSFEGAVFHENVRSL